MKLTSYIKSHSVPIVIYVGTLLVTFFILYETRIPLSLLLLTYSLFVIAGIVIFTYQYIRRAHFMNQLLSTLEKVDKKYLIQEMINEPEEYECALFYHALYESNKAMVDHLAQYKNTLIDFKEYLELWIHEIKIPMAGLSLIIENNKNALSSNMLDELHRIESLVEQVLFYVRSESVEKDYTISECNLDTIVKDVVKENRRQFIYKKIGLTMDGLDKNVRSDTKWLHFVLNQIISNAIKYSKEEDANIIISALEKENRIVLSIQDNGIGILEKDLPRVFEKGFTGDNGRKEYNSTGIGLYLCDRLCESLHHKLNITSKIGEGTCVSITFPIGQYSDIID